MNKLAKIGAIGFGVLAFSELPEKLRLLQA